MAGGLPSSGPSFWAPGQTMAMTSGVRRPERCVGAAPACDAPRSRKRRARRGKTAPASICRVPLTGEIQASMCPGRLDGAILNKATDPVEHSVSYINFVFPVLPGFDDVLHVGGTPALWPAIHGLYARQKIVTAPLVHIHVRAHIHAHTHADRLSSVTLVVKDK